MSHPFELEVRIAQKLARKAGEVARSLKKSSRFSEKKDGEGPVSEADLKADVIIREALCAEFPYDLVISEETATSDTQVPEKGRVWLVDPIDGTADFIAEGLDYSVMIGLLVDGRPSLGVVYEPETESMWTGILWTDASKEKRQAYKTYRDGSETPIDISSLPVLAKNPTVVASKNHPSRLANQIIESLNPAEVIKKGSLGLKIAMIADMRADLYIAASRRIKIWDTCAPAAILGAAGGTILTFSGKSLVYGPSCTHNTPFFAASARYATNAIKYCGNFSKLK